MAQDARLYCSTRAELVEVARGRATAVRATYRGPSATHSLRIRARAVVLAGGAIQTPALLLRSGVKFPGVGMGLRLDPTTAMVGEFAHPIRTWEGPPQTVGVYRFQRLDPGAHGPWLEVAPAHPGLAALATPWQGASDFVRLLERIEYVATPIVLVRDGGEGRVGVDGDGRPVLDYELARGDRTNLTRGLVETARILAAAGATRLLSLTTPYIEAGDGTHPIAPAEQDRFIEEIRRAGARRHSIGLFSAHPMGSARAGPDPRRATARPTGEVHGIDGLWIGDGSLLPTAPGANPMLSIMACAWRTADRLLASLSDGTSPSVRVGG
jgi:choline dehydrogenase-like flavoprotein